METTCVRSSLVCALVISLFLGSTAKGQLPAGIAAYAQRTQHRLENLQHWEAEKTQRHKSGDIDSAIEAAQRSVIVLKQIYGPQSEEVARALESLISLCLNGASHAKALDVARKLQEIELSLHESTHWHVTNARLFVADVEKKRILFSEGVPQIDQTPGPDDVAESIPETDPFRDQLSRAEEKSRTTRQLLGEDSEHYVDSLNDIGILHYQRGDFMRADKVFRKALHYARTTLGENHPTYATILSSLGAVQERQGKYVLAEASYRESLAILERTLGEIHLHSAQANSNLASCFFVQGQYARAEPFVRKSLHIRQTLLGNDSFEYAMSLNDLGQIYKSRGHYTESEKLLRKSSAILRDKLGDTDRIYLLSASNLNELLVLQNKFEEAEEVCKKILEAKRASLGERHIEYAESVGLLADIYAGQGKYELAKALYGTQKDVISDALTESHIEFAIVLQNIARTHLELGEFQQAKEQYKESLKITKEAVGTRHLNYAECLRSLAQINDFAGHYEVAETMLQDTLTIQRQIVGQKHPQYAGTLSDLGNHFVTRGDLDRAEEHFRKSVNVYKAAVGESHPDYAVGLNNLAEVYYQRVEFVQAESLLKQSLEVFKAGLGSDHPLSAGSLYDLSRVARATGDHLRAIDLLKKCLSIYDKSVGKNHPRYLAVLADMASTHGELGEFSQAERIFQEVLEVETQLFGEQHASTCNTMNNLAELYSSQGKHAEALELQMTCLRLGKEIYGNNHPNYATCVNNLALTYRNLGQIEKAEELYRQALDIHRRVLGEQHPKYLVALSNLARSSYQKGNVHAASRDYRTCYKGSERLADLTSHGQSPRAEIAMRNRLVADLSACISVALRLPTECKDIYAELFGFKGASNKRHQRLLAISKHPKLIGKYRDLQLCTSELAAVSQLVSSADSAEGIKVRVRELFERKENIERELSLGSQEYLDASKPSQLNEVLAALPEDAVLVDFFEYLDLGTPGDFEVSVDPDGGSADGNQLREEEIDIFLMAFVSKKGHPIEAIRLGRIDAIRQHANAWRKSIVNGDADPEPDAQRLKQLVWEPLLPHIGSASLVVLSPMGEVSKIPFNALPGQGRGKYLIDEFRLATVPVTQLISVYLDEQPPEGVPPSLFAVGQVNYDATDSTPEKPTSANSGKSVSIIESASVIPARLWDGAEPLRPLPETAAEVLSIRESFESIFKEGTVEVLRNEAATEHSFRTKAPSHRYLHLATHGYFSPPSLRTALSTRDIESETANRFDLANLYPGLLSGIALAGANGRNPDGLNDGILTAEEIVTLDLSRVELAVLSACNTGLGEEAGGEGLLGLQRAFQVAGADSVVATLWEVDDEAASQLMRRFYENLWIHKMSKIDALRESQLSFIEGARSQGRGFSLKSEYPTQKGRNGSPYFWAAYVLSGDWH